MADQKAVQALCEQMKGNKCTAGWDVVCSYAASQINAFLKAQYDASKLAREVTLTTTTPDLLTDTTLTITYRLKFASPVISFVAGRDGYCQFDMPIMAGSTFQIQPQGGEPQAPVKIPEGHTVRAMVPMAAASGTTGAVTELGKVVTFSEGADEFQHVILHFKTAKGITFSMVPEPSDKGRLDVILMPLLVSYFQNDVDQLQYALASINNSTAKEGSKVLTPRSFVLATSGEASDGVLSLFIQVAGSGHPPGDVNPVFQPGGRAASPVPSGASASIILSYDLLTGAFLGPQLASKFATVDWISVTSGIQAKLRSDATVVENGKNENYLFGNCSIDGMSMSLKDFPVTLTIVDTTVRLQWSGKATSSWYENHLNANGGSYGKVDVTFSVDSGALPLGSLSNEDLAIARIKINSSDFHRQTHAHSCDFLETLNHCSESVPTEYGTLPLSIPDISLNLPNLNFFATTNLLAPGKHVVDIDMSAGIRTPKDFLILGNVKVAAGR
ncbi:hypothetical protein [Paraburkholderia sp. SIMBA_054]|uniref:hypothetical protein n=1 Tax=Paraburkholderia sp. SIMBA_054 TaxID=3085795 RepID=UPI00397C8C0E